jgi:iron complex outermembrane receptor protein
LTNTGGRALNLAFGLGHVEHWGLLGCSYRFYANDYGVPGGFVGGHPGGVDIEMRRHSTRAEVEVHPEQGRFVSDLKGTGTFTNYTHLEIEGSGAVGTRFDQRIFSSDILARHRPLGPLSEGAMGVRAQYRDIQTGGSLRTPSTRDLNLAGLGV